MYSLCQCYFCIYFSIAIFQALAEDTSMLLCCVPGNSELETFQAPNRDCPGSATQSHSSNCKRGESIRLREEAAADVTTMAAAMSRGVGCIWRRRYLYEARELSSWILCSCVVFCFVYICKEAALLRIHLCVQLPKDLEFIMVSHVFCLRLVLCTWNT